MTTLSGQATIVVGASRGLGHGIATAFAAAGHPVIAVSRTPAAFRGRAGGAGPIQVETTDAGDATLPARLYYRYHPRAVVVVAGATPTPPPPPRPTCSTARDCGSSDPLAPASPRRPGATPDLLREEMMTRATRQGDDHDG